MCPFTRSRWLAAVSKLLDSTLVTLIQKHTGKKLCLYAVQIVNDMAEWGMGQLWLCSVLLCMQR